MGNYYSLKASMAGLRDVSFRTQYSESVRSGISPENAEFFMMAGIVARREGTPIEDVIGLELGPIYDVNHLGIVHVVLPLAVASNSSGLPCSATINCLKSSARKEKEAGGGGVSARLREWATGFQGQTDSDNCTTASSRDHG